MDAVALNRIYEAKERPANDPIIAHIARPEQLDELARDIPPAARHLANAFWPGALTLVLKRAPGVPENIAAGRDTVAVRMPAHPLARALLLAADVPVGAPSANTFTRPSATTAAHVLEDLDGRIDLVLDGGPTTIGVESTVLDLTGTAPVVLRPGGVLLEELQAVLPETTLAPRYLAEDSASDAPGQLLKHYSPRARVRLFTGEPAAVRARMRAEANALIAAGETPGLLLAEEDITELGAFTDREILGSERDLAAVSRRLFEALRALDRRGVDAILVRDFGREGLGAALWDRLLRAAEGQVIDTAASTPGAGFTADEG
ncbi:YrdC/Sua5 family protein, required for threonylcarbamoyladenosine (t(6)A) formation in tRNA [Pseudohaliea rubra DSM 19751]|uniref:Threonylcarbamoyl-AMP synthase n=2 Tax=Pseudohaliea TaxID=1341120 RepID=A0A095VRF6_9GAMM|nr:YrdC/Sua5 family protein, required for threonylcarbamoyladenosine (t(6)A) formation in tRNA [Pseudohaliea rubra DSM 19751]